MAAPYGAVVHTKANPMTTSPSEARCSAVSSLQGLLSKHRPDSHPYRIAERALDLAFNCPCALGVAPVQELLTEAECIIQRQIRARLIPEASPTQLPFAGSSEQLACPRHVGWRGKLRLRVAERVAQAECGLSAAERSGASYAVVR